MDLATRAALINRYRDGAAAVRKAVAEVGEDGLDRRPSPDQWTAREVVHHLGDSEMTSAVRLRKLLAEHDPVIAAYDEAEFARRLHYDRRIEASLDAMEAARSSSLQLIESLDDAEWARAGTHEESGRYSVETWLEVYAAHLYDHAEQLRQAAGGPLPAR
jgi:hypothetical protein